jgi:carbon-monoxide dehydrogenase large subunit
LNKYKTIDKPLPRIDGIEKVTGQANISGMLAAIANAIRDATGIHFTQLPITPQKVLGALSLPLSPRGCVAI